MNFHEENIVATDILIIDDSEMYVSTLIELLKFRGFHASAVLNASQAMHSIISESPKLVILDIMMPGIDGLSLLKQIKDHPQTASTPVVVVSGKDFPPEKKKALALGAVKFLTKPINSDVLLAEIKPYL